MTNKSKLQELNLPELERAVQELTEEQDYTGGATCLYLPYIGTAYMKVLGMDVPYDTVKYYRLCLPDEGLAHEGTHAS